PTWTQTWILPCPHPPIPSSLPSFKRSLRLLLPFVFATGFILGAGWNRLFAVQSEIVRQTATDLSVAELSPTSPVVETPALSPSSPVVTPSPSVPDQSQPTLSIKAVGDIIPGTNFPNDRLPDQDGVWLFDNVKEYFYGADILFGNFESTLTDYPYSAKDTSRGQTFAFRTPPIYAQLLQQVGFDVLSVANNHSFDFGNQGFEDTIANIEQRGMEAIGRRGEIVYETINGISIAFIGFSYFPDHNSIHDLDTARALVDEAEQQADVIVISVHAGAEGSDAIHTSDQTEYFFGENRGNMVAFSRAMIDQGADLILGHGPHVIRALELYQGRLIAYSLGNFMGYRTLSSEGVLGYSLILQVQLDDQGNFLFGKVVPVRLDDQGVPYIDESFRSVGLIRNLIENDFPETPLFIDETGQILRREAPL
ncbi:MAG: CapA family protein, partial [Cyanobacteria bacterium RU_5_0]|nr:CapA family protein [Cyanobacteria bacterium RU_5_0]